MVKPKNKTKTNRKKNVAKKKVVKVVSLKKTAKEKPLKEEPRVEEKLHTGLTLPVFGIHGEKKGRTTLPEEIFGVPINRQLLLQAVRVYMANQREGGASSKTRGEVEGSTRKIYRQKGTGRARHGGIRAPIFVGGGVAFGPRPHDFHKDFPQKMKKVALVSALTSQLQNGNVLVIDGLDALPAKTKEVAAALRAAGASGTTLLVTPKDAFSLKRGARNIEGLTLVTAEDIHPYAVMSNRKIVFTKESLPILKDRFTR